MGKKCKTCGDGGRARKCGCSKKGGCQGILICRDDIGTEGFVIDRPGKYILERSVVFNPVDGNGCRAAITIEADNVCLDLCCNTLSQFRDENGVGVANVIGIRVANGGADGESPHKNIHIHNGSVVDFSALGIWVEYAVKGILLEDLQLRTSGYLGGSCYPVLDGFNVGAVAWAAGGLAFGGLRADVLAPGAPALPVEDITVRNVESTGHHSGQEPFVKISSLTGLNAGPFPKTIAGIGGSSTVGYEVDNVQISDILEDAPVVFDAGIGAAAGGGTARGFTLADGFDTVLRSVTAQKIACTLGLTAINVTPGSNTSLYDCVAQDVELLADVLVPSRGVVGIGTGGPVPSADGTFPVGTIFSNNIFLTRCSSQDIRVGPNVTGTQEVTNGLLPPTVLFSGGGFATAYNFRGATNVVAENCSGLGVIGNGNVVTSGFHTTSDTIIRGSNAARIRMGANPPDADNASFRLNGVGLLVAPPPSNTAAAGQGPEAVNVNLNVAGTGKSVWRDNVVQNATIGYRVLDTNLPVQPPGAFNLTQMLLQNNSYVSQQAGDEALVVSNISPGGVVQANNVFA